MLNINLILRQSNKYLTAIKCSTRTFIHLTTSSRQNPPDLLANYNKFLIATPVNHLFWERDKKGGYISKTKLSQKKLILDGLKELKAEISLWKDEVKEKLESDPILVFRPGETDVVWKFETENDVNNWIVTTDRDHNEGYSTASLDLTHNDSAVFQGYVDSRLSKDGRVKKSGYCNIKTVRATKSFKRNAYLDWTAYNTMIIRLRGDGRSYLMNLATEGWFDITWNDVYHFVLYTRGGPHWQIARIPFSKFFMSSKGRVQDRQGAIPLNRVTSLGFSVGARGGYDGPFNLEIDYIGLEFDPRHVETFAYEMYKQDKYIAGT